MPWSLGDQEFESWDFICGFGVQGMDCGKGLVHFSGRKTLAEGGNIVGLCLGVFLCSLRSGFIYLLCTICISLEGAGLSSTPTVRFHNIISSLLKNTQAFVAAAST